MGNGQRTGAEGFGSRSAAAEAFDYVIVGGGTAGSILAYRLSEGEKNSVCVLEAGPPDSNPYIRVPAGFTKTMFDSSVTWQFETEPSATTNCRRTRIVQGRTLGGSSAINGMVYNRGPASDFDAWAALGNPGWGYRDVLPYFMRSEQRIGEGDDNFRGRSGPLPVTTPTWSHPLVQAFVDAAVEIGIPHNADYNGARFGGVGRYQTTINRGWRVSAAHAFLKPAKRRSGVSVRTNVLATRILIEDRRAAGVAYSPYKKSGAMGRQVLARKAVIVSAGALNSPKLLQLSGIGSPELLRGLGIDVVRALDGVGKGLHDHFGTRMVARVRGTDSINTRVRGPRLVWEVVKWLVGRDSVIGLGPATVHAYGKLNAESEDPDFVMLCTPACFRPDFSALEDFPGVTIGAYPVRPESAGRVDIASRDPWRTPAIDPNYLSEEFDQRAAIAAGKTARKLMQASPMKRYFEKEHSPGYDVQSDEEWLDFLRGNGMSSCHWSGSCRMGPDTDPLAVVDNRLRVHGLEGLYVVDASIMPKQTSSNTCAPTMMIAEKASDILLSLAR